MGDRTNDVVGSHYPVGGADPLKDVTSYPERPTTRDRTVRERIHHSELSNVGMKGDATQLLSVWSRGSQFDNTAAVLQADEELRASHTASLEERKRMRESTTHHRERTTHAVMKVKGGASGSQTARARLTSTQGHQDNTTIPPAAAAAGLTSSGIAVKGGSIDVMRAHVHEAAMKRYQSTQSEAITHLNTRVDAMLDAWRKSRTARNAHRYPTGGATGSGSGLSRSELQQRIHDTLFPQATPHIPGTAKAPHLHTEDVKHAPNATGTAPPPASSQQPAEPVTLDLEEHHTREKFDALYALLNRLEDGSSELKVWDQIWGDLLTEHPASGITTGAKNSLSGTGTGLWSGCSPALVLLLTRMRAAYQKQLSGFDQLFVEVRRRLQYEWVLSSLKQTKTAVFDTAKSHVDSMQEQLNLELTRTQQQTHQLQLMQSSLRTSLNYAGGAVETNTTTIGATTFPSNAADSHTAAANSTVAGISASSEPLTLESPRRAPQSKGTAAAAIDAAEDDRNGEFSTPTQLLSPSASGIATIPVINTTTNSLTAMADDAASRGSTRPATVDFRGALSTLRSKPKVDIRPIASGARVRGEVSQDAVYYSFELSPDDVGIVIRLEQSPVVLNGTTGTIVDHDQHSHFVELSINPDAPPTREHQTHFISTRDQPGGNACLNLQHTKMAAGNWYIRVIGRGAAHKTFCFEFRVCTQLMDFSGALEQVLGDLDTHTHFRASLTEKMSSLDKLVATVQPRAGGGGGGGTSGGSGGGFDDDGDDRLSVLPSDAGGGGGRRRRGGGGVTTTTVISGTDGRYVMRRRVMTADKGVQATDTPLTVLAARGSSSLESAAAASIGGLTTSPSGMALALAPTSTRSEELRLAAIWPPPMGQFEPLLHFPAPELASVRVLSKSELYTLLYQIYAEKMNVETNTATASTGGVTSVAGSAGTAAPSAAAPLTLVPHHEYTLAQFIYRVFHRKYGLAKLAEIHIYELVYSLLKHAVGGHEPRVRTFARFIHVLKPHYTPADVQFYLTAWDCTRKHIVHLAHLTRADMSADTNRLIEDGQCTVTSSTLAASAGELFATKAWAPYIAQRLQHRFIPKPPPAANAPAAPGSKSAAAAAAHPNAPVVVDYDEWLQMLLDAHTGGSSLHSSGGHDDDDSNSRLRLQHLFATVDATNQGLMTFDQFVGLLRAVSWWYSDLDIFILFRHATSASHRADVITVDGFLSTGSLFRILDKPINYRKPNAAAAAAQAALLGVPLPAAGANTTSGGVTAATLVTTVDASPMPRRTGDPNDPTAGLVSAAFDMLHTQQQPPPSATGGATVELLDDSEVPPPSLPQHADVPLHYRNAFTPALIPLRTDTATMTAFNQMKIAQLARAHKLKNGGSTAGEDESGKTRDNTEPQSTAAAAAPLPDALPQSIKALEERNELMNATALNATASTVSLGRSSSRLSQRGRNDTTFPALTSGRNQAPNPPTTPRGTAISTFGAPVSAGRSVRSRIKHTVTALTDSVETPAAPLAMAGGTDGGATSTTTDTAHVAVRPKAPAGSAGAAAAASTRRRSPGKGNKKNAKPTRSGVHEPGVVPTVTIVTAATQQPALPLMDRALNELLESWAILQPLIVSQLSLMQRVLQVRHADYLHATLMAKQHHTNLNDDPVTGSVPATISTAAAAPNVSVVMQLSVRVAAYKELLLKLTAHRQAIGANQTLRALQDKQLRKLEQQSSSRRQRQAAGAPPPLPQLPAEATPMSSPHRRRRAKNSSVDASGNSRSPSRHRAAGSDSDSDHPIAPLHAPGRSAAGDAKHARAAHKRRVAEEKERNLREREERSVLIACAQVWTALGALLKDINDTVLAHPIPLFFNRTRIGHGMGGGGAGANAAAVAAAFALQQQHQQLQESKSTQSNVSSSAQSQHPQPQQPAQAHTQHHSDLTLPDLATAPMPSASLLSAIAAAQNPNPPPAAAHNPISPTETIMSGLPVPLPSTAGGRSNRSFALNDSTPISRSDGAAGTNTSAGGSHLPTALESGARAAITIRETAGVLGVRTPVHGKGTSHDSAAKPAPSAAVPTAKPAPATPLAPAMSHLHARVSTLNL